MSNLLKLYSTFIVKRPFLAQAVQTGILMGVGDVIAQTAIEKKSVKEIGWWRTARFASVGFVFVGPTLRVWYGVMNKYIKGTEKTVAIKKVAADQLLFAPAFLFVLVATLGAIEGKGVNETLKETKRNYPDILITSYKIWPAAQMINFYFLPLQYQVLFVQVVAIFWNTYLSWKVNKPEIPVEIQEFQ